MAHLSTLLNIWMDIQNWGITPWMVKLIAYPNNLTIVRVVDDKTLFSIPWGNLQFADRTVMHKKGLRLYGALLYCIA